jgi:hypothetical protein
MIGYRTVSGSVEKAKTKRLGNMLRACADATNRQHRLKNVLYAWVDYHYGTRHVPKEIIDKVFTENGAAFGMTPEDFDYHMKRIMTELGIAPTLEVS